MKWETLLSNLISQLVSLGLGAFFWEYIKERFKKVDDLDKRVMKMELREEVKRELEGRS